MTIRQLPPSEYLGLKAAFRDLVDACGGPVRAAKLTRVSQQQISRCMSPDEEFETHFAALDVIADLECECGQPIVTRYLAEIEGHAVGRLPDRRRRPNAPDLIGRVTRVLSEVADVSGGVAAALSDASISRAEQARLHGEVREALEALMDLDNTLALAAGRKGDGDV